MVSNQLFKATNYLNISFIFILQELESRICTIRTKCINLQCILGDWMHLKELCDIIIKIASSYWIRTIRFYIRNNILLYHLNDKQFPCCHSPLPLSQNNYVRTHSTVKIHKFIHDALSGSDWYDLNYTCSVVLDMT